MHLPIRTLSLCAVLLLGAGLCWAHPFYVSVCQVDHNPSSQALEISLKIFLDDLERTLQPPDAPPLRLGTEREAEGADRLVFDYLRKRLMLKVDGRTASLQWVGREVEDDTIWCYMEVLGVPKINTIEVASRLLLETFDTQTNIVHIRAQGDTKSLLLRRGKVRGSVSFQ